MPEVMPCDFGGEARRGDISTGLSLETHVLRTQVLDYEVPLAT